ncbi:MAG: hypothetical protein NE327_20340 [Lentisphaeraceae bacterium]|nr:hypothetical protein [Lentisphaeraceae bacterium]
MTISQMMVFLNEFSKTKEAPRVEIAVQLLGKPVAKIRLANRTSKEDMEKLFARLLPFQTVW